ncbi:MAG: inositol monophosphatase [Planctomycetes bacterium]|nr:inositol monophosphatase [Planctomycetota bacterium]
MPIPSLRIRRDLLRTARDAARVVGPFVAKRHRPYPRSARRKGPGDFVTETDVAAERKLGKMLLSRYPDHGFLGEETKAVRLDAEYVWVVDPIDGTSNFAQGLPLFAVSIACLHQGEPIAAACWTAPEGVVHSAGHGLGAFRERRRLSVPRARLDDSAVVGVQWYRDHDGDLRFARSIVETGVRVRVFGSTVTELCDVATGRLHANVQEQGKLWDFAAAALIVLEAGGRFTTWAGDPVFPIDRVDSSRHYPSIAASPNVHRRLVELLGSH